jgi:hypothetical protein
MSEGPEPESYVVRDPTKPVIQYRPALSNVQWLPQIVAQSLEAILAYLDPSGAAHYLHPIHAESLRVGWRADKEPGEIVMGAAVTYGLRPRLVHSTSWRYESSRLVLTYVVVVEDPSPVLDDNLADVPVERADLARGDATGPPVQIEVAQVLEHAFRHLAWLVKDDAVVRDTLPQWHGFLAAYEPEPFRAFGTPGVAPG